jgi:hypothetical protein
MSLVRTLVSRDPGRTTCWKRHEADRGKNVFVLTNQILWVVAPCGWAIPSRRFEETYRLHLQIYESVNWLITLKMKAILFFEASGRNYPTTRRNNPKYLISQHSCGGNLKSRFDIVNNVFLSVHFIFFIYYVLLVHGWFSMKEWIDEIFHACITMLLKKSERKWEYCSVLSVGTKNCKNMVVFTAVPSYTVIVHLCGVQSCLLY